MMVETMVGRGYPGGGAPAAGHRVSKHMREREVKIGVRVDRELALPVATSDNDDDSDEDTVSHIIGLFSVPAH